MKENRKKSNRIAQLRRQNGISQEKLAEELNVTQAGISLYENGSNIPTDILIAIAGYFGVTLEYLLKLPDDENHAPIDSVSEIEHGILSLFRKLSRPHQKLVGEIVNLLLSECGMPTDFHS